MFLDGRRTISVLKRYVWLVVGIALFIFQVVGGAAIAAELDAATRTVPLNAAGDTITLTQKQVADGKRLFNYACGQCHVGGVTKTDPNVGLDPETLALATPPRTSIETLVDYMNNPTTYDGQTEISELHPSTKSTDIFPKMRNLTQDDLKVIAGHILIQPKVVGAKWGGGKIYY
ncbi:MAG: cytochrome c-550 [Cyanobacteria bacterium J069]|nr:MAG: cytochrome c-550 [Cyanobacteria bacterium J069]